MARPSISLTAAISRRVTTDAGRVQLSSGTLPCDPASLRAEGLLSAARPSAVTGGANDAFVSQNTLPLRVRSHLRNRSGLRDRGRKRAEAYAWEAGEVGNGPIPVTYLIGLPPSTSSNATARSL